MANNTNGYPLRLVLTAIDRITAPLNRIQQRLNAVTAPARAVGNAVASLGQVAGVQKLGAALAGVGSAAYKVGEEALRLGKRVAIGVAAAGFGLYELVQRTVDSAAALRFQANRLDLTPSQLSAWGFAAKQAGIDQEGFFNGLDFFSKTMGQLKGNQGPLFELLKKNWPDVIKQFKGTKDVASGMSLLLSVADRLGDKEKQAALFRAGFGRGSRAAQDLVTEGVGKFRQAIAEFKELNGGQDLDAFAQESVEFVKAENRIGVVWDALQRTLLKPVLPVLEQQMKRLTSFLNAHREEVAAWAKRFSESVKNFFDELPDRISKVINVLERLQKAAEPIARIFGGWPELFATIAALILSGPLIGALGKLTIALAALGAAEITTPIGAVAAAVQAIAAAAIIIIANWDPIKKYFKELWAGVKMEFEGFLDFLEGAFTRDLTKTMLGLRKIANPLSFVNRAAPEAEDDPSKGPKSAFLKKWIWTRPADMHKSSYAQRALRERSGKLGIDLPQLQGFFAWLDGVSPDSDQSGVLPSKPIRSQQPIVAAMQKPSSAAAQLLQQARVLIQFENSPKGMRSSVVRTPGAPGVDLSTGYAMAGSH